MKKKKRCEKGNPVWLLYAKGIVALLSFSLLLMGCAVIENAEVSVPAATMELANVVSFVDAMGRTVTVENPTRVAALIGSFADIWCLADGQETLVAAAEDAWTQFDLNLPDSVVHLGSTSEPNVEILLAAQPDLVLASTRTASNVDLLPILEDSGITTAYFEVSTFEQYLSMLEICTRISGKTERYFQYGEQIRDQIGAVISRMSQEEKPSVLYLRATGSSCKVKNSKNSVLGEMLAALGCVNVADGNIALLEELSLEAILEADPDHIFIVMQGSDMEKVEKILMENVFSNPAWQELRAVKTGCVHYMDQHLYNLKPNARWGEAYEKLADILYKKS